MASSFFHPFPAGKNRHFALWNCKICQCQLSNFDLFTFRAVLSRVYFCFVRDFLSGKGGSMREHWDSGEKRIRPRKEQTKEVYFGIKLLPSSPTESVQYFLILDETVIGKESRFFLRNGALYLEELFAKRGTYLNGRRLRPGGKYLLEHDDLIVIGPIEMKVLKIEGESELKKFPFRSLQTMNDEEEEVDLPPTPDESEEKEVESPPVFLDTKDKAPLPKSPRPLASGIQRTSALCLDYFICLFGMSQFIKHPEMEKMNAEIHHSLLDVLTKVSPLPHQLNVWITQYQVPTFALCWVALQLLSHLLWGTSLGQRLAGINGEGGIIWNRIGGTIRSFFSFLFMPLFFLTELWPWYGKRTLKEWLTATRLVRSSRLVLAFSYFFILPIMVVGLLGLPYGIDHIFNGKKQIITVQELPELSVPSRGLTTTVQNGLMYSPYFQMGINKDIVTRFDVYAYFEIIHNFEQKKIRPHLVFYHPQKQMTLDLKVQGMMPLFSLLSGARDRHPLFKRVYPHLWEFLRKEVPDGTLLPEGEIISEVKNLFRRSFEIQRMGPQVLVNDHWTNDGPNPLGYWYVRDQLRNLSPEKGQMLATFSRLGDQEFLLLKVQEESVISKNKRHYFLLPLQMMGAPILQVDLEENLAADDVAHDILAPLIQKAKWQGENRNLGGNSPFNVLSLVDELPTKDLDPKRRGGLNEYLYHSSFDRIKSLLGREAKGESSKNLSNSKTLLAESLEQTLAVLATIREDQGGSAAENPTPTEQGLLQMKGHLENSNYDFFEISKE